MAWRMKNSYRPHQRKILHKRVDTLQWHCTATNTLNLTPWTLNRCYRIRRRVEFYTLSVQVNVLVSLHTGQIQYKLVQFTAKFWIKPFLDNLNILNPVDCILYVFVLKVDTIGYVRTDPFRPGKLKKTSGPFRCGICRSTLSSFAECRG